LVATVTTVTLWPDTPSGVLTLTGRRSGGTRLNVTRTLAFVLLALVLS
jgi:hypothetical protein